MKKFLLPILAAAALSLPLSACGSLPAADDELGSMSLLSAEGAAGQRADSANGGQQHGRGRHRGKGGPGGHGFGPMGMMGLGHVGELGLSEDQQARFKALQDEARTFFESHKPAESAKADHQAARKAFEEAFKSDHFDPAALAAKLPQRPVPDVAMLDFQVDQIVKAHGILTADQRAKLVAGRAKAPAERPGPQAAASDRQSARLDRLATDLGLSADQKSKLAAIFTAQAEARAKSWESRKREMDAKHKAMSEMLTQSSIDRTALKAALAERFAIGPDKAGHFEQLAKIHAVLTPEQRAKFVSLGGKGFGGPGGPGGPGGHGGRGGHPGGHRGHRGR